MNNILILRRFVERLCNFFTDFDRVIPVGLTALFLLMISSSGLAATFTVTKTADTNDGLCDADCSLREAISAANSVSSTDTIEFSPLFATSQTIVLSGVQLQVDNNGALSIIGPGANLLTIDANHASPVFRIEGATAGISSVKIANGTSQGSGGGILNQLGNLTVNNSVISGNSTGSGGEGGGIRSCGGNVTITNSTLSNNFAGSQGGGAVASGDSCVSGRPHSLTISNSSIINNSTTNNGGGVSSSSPTTIVNTVISGNSANIAGGVLIYFPSSFGTFDHVSFINNHATTSAGGMQVARFDTITDCVFSGNTAGTLGGGLLVGESALEKTIVRSSFSMNSAQDGGAMYDFRGQATVRDSTFDNNHASRNGGAIYFETHFVSTSISNSQITNNIAGQSGGGIYNIGGGLNLGSVSIANNISNNNSTGGGGGLFSATDPIVVTNSTISGNTTNANGGGLFLDINVSNATITNSVIANNVAEYSGGGIYKRAGTLNLISSSISGNRSNVIDGSAGGGGIYNRRILNISNSTISGNNTAGRGGGVYALGFRTNTSVVDIVNSTYSGNGAAAAGGAIFNHATGGIDPPIVVSSIIVRHSTFSDNSASTGAGGIHNLSEAIDLATVQASGSIFKTGTGANFNATTTSLGYNLSDDNSGGFFTNTGDQINTDPILGQLQNNGGPTLTHALLTGSPAINTGNPNFVPPPDNDQRGPGFTRVYNDRIDKGSFEVQPFTRPTLFDFDGDRKADLSIFRPGPGEWWWSRSSDGGNSALQFGAATDRLAPVDFTGDGKTDVAFWRPETGEWFVLRSEDFSFYAFPFGATGDVPVPGDYDGDGKADAAVFRESAATWYISRSSGGTDIIGFGAAGDRPVNADYDGDGKADIAIYRPNGPGGAEWWVRRSSNASVFALQFGSATDKAVPGDFTGDGKADVAFWRPATGFWNILRSEDFSYYAFPFGANGDVASPGDYDGDGKLDAAVFRPSNSTWYANRSTAGTLIQQFGAAGDVPVPSAFVR